MQAPAIVNKISKRVCLKTITLAALLCFCYPLMANSFDGEISRAFFTTKLKNTEPQNEVLILENDNTNVYFFSEVKNMQGKTLVHRWEYQGKTVYDKKFRVSKGQQKLVSNFKPAPRNTGEWMVVITDGRGWPIKAVIFRLVKKGSFAGKGILPVKKD